MDNTYMTNEKEYNKIKNAFDGSFLEKSIFAKGGLEGNREIEVSWTLKKDEQRRTLFGYHASVNSLVYTYQYYVYPLAYDIINYINLQKEAPAVEPKPKQKEYIVTENCLRGLLAQHACYYAVMPNGDRLNPYVVSAIKHKYPEAYREGEGIYWDALEDMFLESYNAVGEVREYKK